jgi:RHS repeat-associated protein
VGEESNPPAVCVGEPFCSVQWRYMSALLHVKSAASPATYACDYGALVAKVALIGVTTTYAYDAFGQRVMQATASSTTWYPNQYMSVTIATSSTNGTSTDYLYAGDTQLETVDQPLVNGVATGTSTLRYIHTDNLGSTNITSDANQNRAQWFDYAPYGSVIASTNTGTTTDARQYIGQFSDASGLSYLNARYYNGAQGQFTSEDPIFLSTQQNLGDPQSLNAYSYAEGNPINRNRHEAPTSRSRD